MNLSLEAAIKTLQEWGNGLIASLPNILVGILLILLFYFIGKGIRNLITRATETHQRSKNVGMVVGRLAFGLTILVGFFIALTVIIPSFTAAELLTTLGFGSVAIGFAFKDILQNFLAGILILLTEPFRIGDQIVVNDFEGTVETIETRATKIRTYDNRLVVIPNANMFTDSVTVNTAFDLRRTDYDFGIDYGDDIEKAKKIMLEVMNATEGVATDPAPDVLTVALADSSVNIRGRWWTDPRIKSVLDVKDDVVSTVKKRFDESGITIPWPVRTLVLPQQTKEAINVEVVGKGAKEKKKKS